MVKICVKETGLEEKISTKSRNRMEIPLIKEHRAVRVKDHVIVFNCPLTNSKERVIWSCNLFTEQCKKYEIPDKECAPLPIDGASAVAIEADVYMFGGLGCNSLWRLTISENNEFTWFELQNKRDCEVPSPREYHSAWEYERNMWIFGGIGYDIAFPVANFLNEHGDFIEDLNNQLLCYDPCHEMWTNPQCSGAVPSPRICHATAILGDKVWLYGGRGHLGQTLADFHVMNMESYVWVEIEAKSPNPGPRLQTSLTAATGNQIVLHGGGEDFRLFKDTWIFEVDKRTWRTYKRETDHPRYRHTGIRGLGSSVVIIGGRGRLMGSVEEHKSIFHVVLETKSLQHLAMQSIYQHRDMIPWQSLPNKLIEQLKQLIGPAWDEEHN